MEYKVSSFYKYSTGYAPVSKIRINEEKTSTIVSIHNIYKCRESFLYYFRSSLHKSRFVYNNRRATPAQIARVIDFVNKKLNLSKKDCAKLVGVHDKSFVIFVPAWWTEYMVRVSFLTVALRGSLTIKDEEEVEPQLRNKSYFRGTKRAFDLFLNGHTKRDEKFAFHWYDDLNEYPHEILKK